MKVFAILMIIGSIAGVSLGLPQGYNYDAPAAPVSYSFGYDVNAIDPYNRPVQFGHNEGREGHATTGSYYVLLPDNRLMTVNYVADQNGFHPTYSFQQLGGQAVASTPTQLYNTPSAGGQAVASTPSQLYNTPLGK